MKRLLWLFIISGLLCGCAPKEETQTVFCMDTVMEFKLWGSDAEEGIRRVTQLMQETEKTWSATDESSDLNRGTADKAVLDRAEEMQSRTGGAFDPKLRSVMTLWGFYDKNYRIPTGDEISAAPPLWDLGGVIKGYAGDLAVQELQKLEVERGILNLGGNVQTYGQKADGSPWQIALQNPRGGEYLGIISVVGTKAVVTSGDYQRYFEENGVRYHHILNPKTGYPADAGLASVTVVCGDGFTADALSTALFVMGLEEGSAHWRATGDFEAVFVLTTGEVYATEGVSLSGCEFEVIRREN